MQSVQDPQVVIDRGVLEIGVNLLVQITTCDLFILRSIYIIIVQAYCLSP